MLKKLKRYISILLTAAMVMMLTPVGGINVSAETSGAAANIGDTQPSIILSNENVEIAVGNSVGTIISVAVDNPGSGGIGLSYKTTYGTEYSNYVKIDYIENNGEAIKYSIIGKRAGKETITFTATRKGTVLATAVCNVTVVGDIESPSHTCLTGTAVSVYHAAVMPDCENDGSEEYYECSVCNKMFEDPNGKKVINQPKVKPALGHNYALVSGTGGRHCLKCTNSKCGQIKPDSYEYHTAEGDFITDKPNYNYQKYHYQKCKCGMVMGSPHEWDDGVEENGVNIYTCKACGKTKTETVTHNYVLTPDGTGLQHCLKCTECDKIKPDSYENHAAEGDFITDNPNYNYQEYHYQNCKCGMVIGIIHTSDNGTITKQPTANEAGVKTFKCTVCGEVTKTETVPALGGGSVTPSDPSNPPDPSNPTDPSKPASPLTPVRPVASSQPDNGAPFIKSESGKSGWDAIKSEAESADKNGVITVDMNGATVVPENVFDTLRGRDVTVVFDIGGGITWSVNGKDIISDKTSDIDLSVKADTDNIPVDVINNITGERYGIQISLAHNGEFGFTAVLSINLGSGNAGQKASLYYYNGDTLKLMCESKISADGTAQLMFTHASDYLIVIGESKTNESDTSNTTSGTTSSGDVSEPGKKDSDEQDGNPSTGVTTSLTPLAIAAAFIVVAAAKRKMK